MAKHTCGKPGFVTGSCPDCTTTAAPEPTPPTPSAAPVVFIHPYEEALAHDWFSPRLTPEQTELLEQLHDITHPGCQAPLCITEEPRA